jgi:hypothetical protein
VNTSVWKRGALAIGGATLLLSASIGFSQAQSATPSTANDSERRQHHAAVIELAAAKLGLSSDEVSTALKEARKDPGRGQGHPQVGKLIHQELSVAATALGIADVKALRKELAGTTLAAVAQAHHVPASTVAAAIKADVDARLQALVTAGKLKAERAATLQVKADAKVDAFMTHEFKTAGPAA